MKGCGGLRGLSVSPDIADIAEIPPEPRGFSSKKNLIIIAIAAVLALGGVGAAAAVGASNRAAQSAPGGIQLAERYLSEMNYEQAVIEYQRILEIEPRNVEAYLGLAEAYIGLGDTEKALEILHKGFEITGDQRLLAKIDKLTKPPVSSSTVSSSLSSSSSGNTSEPEESSSSSAASSSETESSSTLSATESSVTPSSSSGRPEESSSRPTGSNMQSSVPVVNYSPESDFAGCDLTSLTIPDGVTEIGDFAFSDNTELESVNIPDSVTKIGSGVFSASYEGGPGCEKVIVTYKGNTCDYGHINDLYSAVNG